MIYATTKNGISSTLVTHVRLLCVLLFSNTEVGTVNLQNNAEITAGEQTK